MSKKKLLVMNLAVMIGLGSSFAIPSAKAETESVSDERTKIQADIGQADQNAQRIQAEIQKLSEQKQRVAQAIEDNNNKINQTQSDIKAANKIISETNTEIKELETAIQNRTEILKQRAISYQHSGGNVEYIDVLLGSSSFSDFVNRAIAVGKIVEADRTMMEQQEADQNVLEEKKAAKLQSLAKLNELNTELKGMQEHLNGQKVKNDALAADLKNEKTANEAAIRSLKQKEADLAAQEALKKQLASAASQGQASQTAAVEQTKASAKTVASAEKSSTESKQTTSSPKSSPAKETVAATPVNPSGSVNDLIRAGYKYFGNSVYVFGGGRSASDIANGRFDCSGFVIWAFSTVGVQLSGNTDSLKNAGTQVSTSSMRPGDLVFFDTYKRDGHVGIYVGGGKFIGSQSSTGVAIANMSSGYWGEKFNGRVVRVNF
ncbi:peptidase [Bacillus sp. SA1-12]|uniref:C40 family peptidase n=1 Tax=Bacillus sp. SA1-12 TaxID=1455638 RepID=UPI00062536D3|nr:C40 family peptidase [Bacillus sp. SA1-12]KKI93450.1 peptidase [Bacillus sp. SA1-12]